MLPVHDAFTVLRILGIKAFVMRWNREKLVLSCQEVEPRVPGLRHQCSITELQQPDNHLADSCCNLIDNPRSCEPCHPHPSARGSRSVCLLLTPSALIALTQLTLCVVELFANVWPLSSQYAHWWSRFSSSFLSLMPKKVSFKVVYCTGWEDDYPPKDLEVRDELLLSKHFVWLLWFLFTTDCCSPAGAQSVCKGLEVT